VFEIVEVVVVIRYPEALSKIFSAGHDASASWDSVAVSLGESYGQVLAQSVVSAENFPMFDASLFDGFALRAADTNEASKAMLRVPVTHHVHAGGGSSGKVEKGCAVGISTGALLPTDADVVVKIEDVEILERNSDGMPKSIGLKGIQISGDGIRYRGTDVRAKQSVLEKGTRIDFQHFPLLAALGVQELKVLRRVRVGIVSTGDEIVDWSSPQDPGSTKIRNATGAFLAVALQGMGCDLVHYCAVGDNGADYRAALQEALAARCDVVVSTGAVSMGPKDFVESVLQGMGADILFHRVAMRPGKPALCAKIGSAEAPCMLFALPGNPMSTAVGLRFLVTPYLRCLMKAPEEPAMRVAIGNDVVNPKGLHSFLLGKVSQTDSGLKVYVPAEQESFRVLPFSRSNVWVVLPEVSEGLAMGDLVEILPIFADGFSRGWPVSG
jgi:molybdopterin molybdotransferase